MSAHTFEIGDTVRIACGMLRGKLGHIVDKVGGVFTVRHASGTATFRERELEQA